MRAPEFTVDRTGEEVEFRRFLSVRILKSVNSHDTDAAPHIPGRRRGAVLVKRRSGPRARPPSRTPGVRRARLTGGLA